MLRDSELGSPKKIFHGIRFFLFGFDSVSKSQYLSELVGRGGVDVGRYDPSCTHVIVSGRIFDDPMCVASRNDGKTLVTDLWIDDSVDFGRLADATRILYRPVKDFNGIPRSDTLYICLTGYQWPERDDIKKMVDLMGAHFSKPLIATKITHLICYKFEGEKYELAKRKNIKLVNHLWLEDCLKAWEILPTDAYTKSGWELDVLVVEAKDSEEETENDIAMPLTRRCTRDLSKPNDMLKPGNSKLSMLTEKSYKTQKDVETDKLSRCGTKDIFTSDKLFCTPSRAPDCDNASHMHGKDNTSQMADRQNGQDLPQSINVYAKIDAFDDRAAFSTCNSGINLNNEGNKLPLGARITRSSLHSDTVEEKVPPLTYSRKMPRKSVSPDELSHLHSSTQGNLFGTNIKDTFGPSPLADKHGKGTPEADIQISSTYLDLHQIDLPSHTLPQKRKASVPIISSSSPNSAFQCSETKVPLSLPMATRSAELEHTPFTNANEVKIDHTINHYVSGGNSPLGGVGTTNSTANHDIRPPILKSLSYKRRAVKHRQPLSGIKSSTVAVSPPGDKVLLCGRDRQHLDRPTESAGNLSVLGTRISDGPFPSADDVMTEICNNVETSSAEEEKLRIRSAAKYLKALASGRKDAHESRPMEKEPQADLVDRKKNGVAPQSNNSVNSMGGLANISTSVMEQARKLKLDESAPSPDRRDSDSNKLPSTNSPGSLDASKVETTSEKLTKKKTVTKKKICNRLKLNAMVIYGGEISNDTNKNLAGNKSAFESDKMKGKTEKLTSNEDAMLGLASKAEVVDNPLKAVQCSSKSNNENVELDLIGISKDSEKENRPVQHASLSVNPVKCGSQQMDIKRRGKPKQKCKSVDKTNDDQGKIERPSQSLASDPVCFILSGHRLQRKEFQQVIRRLGGMCCRDSHQWSQKATHLILPDPVRRTEKFFSAAAAGRWILKTDYLTASYEAGKFLAEGPFEWHKNDAMEDGAIDLEAPRKWRLLRERTSHGAFYGMHIITYGECIAPPLGTVKRAVKAGDGTVLATSPPYTRFLKSGVDFAIISPGIPQDDFWVQEFLRHEIPCVLVDYLVEYVCKPGHSLKEHVLFNTHAWAEKSFTNLSSCLEKVVSKASVR